ncbi:MAG: hypothetical protein APZ16_00095 [Candidatus Hadarchaeum yellowstonense]|uniref:Uncharacterized protein n=1 Tax=Hadarchaeum yellowstonense TaxID=1776334 RepID=A0A147JYI7_HADYE|nr:MAG: hypothetical protein APZ16_00095 [Candidatus Hadarchaeum yellowstonense]
MPPGAVKLHDQGLAVSFSKNVQDPQLELSVEYLYQRATLATPESASDAVAVIVKGTEVRQYGEIAPTDEEGGVTSTVSVSETIVDQFPAASLALTEIVWVPSASAGVVNVKLTERAGVKASTSAQVPPSTLYSMSTTFVNASVAVPE